MKGFGRTEERPTVLVDAIGLTCPMPVLMAHKALRDLPDGALLTLRASDPLARIDIPHFCRENGHALLEQCESDGVLTFLMRKG